MPRLILEAWVIDTPGGLADNSPRDLASRGNISARKRASSSEATF